MMAMHLCMSMGVVMVDDEFLWLDSRETLYAVKTHLKTIFGATGWSLSNQGALICCYGATRATAVH